MLTASEYSTEAAVTQPDEPVKVAGELMPAAPAVQPRRMWPLRDLLLVGVVIGLAIGSGVTAVRQAGSARARMRLADDLRAAAAAFQAHLREQGTAPADTNPGVVPPGMARYLASVDWTAPTPAGGYYRWVNLATGEAGAPVAGMIAITAFPRSPPLTLGPADWLEIDRRIDDGNLATGSFRLGFNGWPVLWVRAAP